MIGRGEVKLGTRCPFDICMTVKLGAIVGGDGLEQPWVFLNQLNHSLIGYVLVPRLQLADQQITGFALYDRYDTGLGTVSTHHRIDLAVTVSGSIFSRQRAL